MSSTPIQQSDIDGLCGLICILNAIKYLYPQEFDGQITLSVLKYELLNEIPNFKKVWLTGLHPRKLKRLLKVAKRFLNKHELEFEWGSLASIGAFVVDNEQFWRVIGPLLTENCCMLIGLGEPEPHWTIVTHVDKKYIHFFDSSGVKKEEIKSFELGISRSGLWHYEPRDVYIIRR